MAHNQLYAVCTTAALIGIVSLGYIYDVNRNVIIYETNPDGYLDNPSLGYAESLDNFNNNLKSVNAMRHLGSSTRGSLVWNDTQLKVPFGLRPTDEYDTHFFPYGTPTSLREAEQWYNDVYSEMTSIECEYRSRAGRSKDGGWNVCMAGVYGLVQPCLVYSFGINNDWSFDDDVSQRYGCVVRAFDPSINLSAHVRKGKIHFYPYGLGGKNETNSQGWNMLTLESILKKLGDENRIIDYLKIDIESSEWPSFNAMFQESTLYQVKQLALEAHTIFIESEWHKYINVLYTLDKLGFKKWDTHNNIFTGYGSEGSKYYTYGKEHVYVNVNFMDPQYVKRFSMAH